MKRFLILCAILALVLICADAWADWDPAIGRVDIDLHTDADGGGRTSRQNFFDHEFEARSAGDLRRWRDRDRPGVERVEGGILFRYRDRDYEQVWLRCDRRDWEEIPMELDRERGAWEVVIELAPGALSYQFRVERDDGTVRDRTDPTNPTRRRDADQGWVSRVEIPGEGEVEIRERERDERRRHVEAYDLSLFSGFGMEYQRADGFLLRARPAFESREAWAPALHAEVKYGFSSERGAGRLAFVQPLSPDGRVRAVISGYDITDFTERTGVGDVENSLATLAFREDSRDWYRRKGLGFGVELEEVHRLLLRLEFRSDEYRTLPKKVVAGWGGREDFLPIPAIDDGLMRSLLLRARWGGDFTHLWVQYENGRSGVFSTRFDFSQVIVQGRMRWQIGWAQTLQLRARWGRRLTGELPVQKSFVAGGIGTVRGYNYQSLFTPREPGEDAPYGGEEIGLFNAEYLLGFHDDLGIGLFYDAGMVYEEAGSLRLGDFRNSIGFSLVLGDAGESSLRLDFAQPLIRDGSLLVQGRLTRPF